MSTVTTLTLQNAFDLPSPVTLHFEDSEFDINCPYSPTSSLKGVLIRSRPSSMEISERDLPAEFGQFGMTSNIHVPFIQAVPARKAAGLASKAMADATSGINTSATLTPIPLRAVRRVLAEDEENSDEAMPPTDVDGNAPAIYRRTWPSMEVLRRRVSGIFHRKDASHVPRAPSSTTSDTSLADATTTTHVTPPSRPRRTFSFSLRARAGPTTKIPEAPTSVVNAARAQRVRRSRSFAGFTYMAHRVLDPIPEPDVELDEIGLEAYNIARETGQFWVYEEDGGSCDRSIGTRGRACMVNRLYLSRCLCLCTHMLLRGRYKV
ncbi:hypothetical protein MSAN_01965000 [Mycena sanguinolenta]|uniref:Uncharacterized protein n=1 Tax=Mycena sanguinolenta TaxID=230812 RepID=A0A8H6XM92_9AGAR|nr:hypothetical protein MSAN_01965000 [Mycena sanguinolenta]